MSKENFQEPSAQSTAVNTDISSLEQAPEAKVNNYDPPDGGWKAWSTAGGASLVAFATFGFVNGFGVFVDYYNEEYLTNYSPTVITMIGALQVFVLYIFAGLSGTLFDAYGPKYIMPISGVLVVFSLFMLSLTKPQQIYQQYLTQTILFSPGASSSFFPAIALQAHWFKRKTAYAVGCVTAGASAGGIVFPIMLDRLIPRIGFGWAVRVAAFIVLFCFVVACLMMHQRRPMKPLPPLSRLLAFEAFKDPRFAILAAGSWFSIFAVFNPFFYVGLYGTTANGESKLTPYFLAIMCATSIPGRVIPGIIADRVGRWNVIFISTLLSAIFILSVWYTSTAQPNIIAFAALYGFTSGPFFALLPACIATISPVERIGARVGIMFAFLSTGGLAGTPIAGVFIRERTVENFRHLILFSGVMGLVGALLIGVARFVKSREIFAAV